MKAARALGRRSRHGAALRRQRRRGRARQEPGGGLPLRGAHRARLMTATALRREGSGAASSTAADREGAAAASRAARSRRRLSALRPRRPARPRPALRRRRGAPSCPSTTGTASCAAAWASSARSGRSGETVARMAVAAATQDGRFARSPASELDGPGDRDLGAGAAVRCAPRRWRSGRHGLLLRLGGRSGVLLPQVAVEHGWDREEFLAKTARKAGLPRGRLAASRTPRSSPSRRRSSASSSGR